MNYIYIKKCDNVNLFLINMKEYNKKSQFLVKLVDEIFDF